MSKKIQYGLMGFAVILSFVAGNAVIKWYQSNQPPEVEARAMQSQKRPAFTLPDIDGNMRSVSEWDGQVLVVNFWATWCPPCRREMPEFVDMQEKYGAKGLQFVGIALDEADKVRDFLDTQGVEYPNLLGNEKAVEVTKAYGNRFGSLPYTAIIDRSGHIVFTKRGELERDLVESVILPLL